MYREFDIGLRRRRDEIERDRTLVWMTEALRRQEKMPPFKSWLAPVAQPQGPADIVRQMQAISDLYGLKLRRTRKES